MNTNIEGKYDTPSRYIQVFDQVSHTQQLQTDSLSTHHQGFHSKTFKDAQSMSVLPLTAQVIRSH